MTYKSKGSEDYYGRREGRRPWCGSLWDKWKGVLLSYVNGFYNNGNYSQIMQIHRFDPCNRETVGYVQCVSVSVHALFCFSWRLQNCPRNK
jgi:hypothetical protein